MSVGRERAGAAAQGLLRMIAQVELSVNGTALRVDPPGESGDFSEVRQEWLAEEAGLHTLQVRAFDSSGAAVMSENAHRRQTDSSS